MNFITDFYARTRTRRVLITLIVSGLACLICDRAIDGVDSSRPWGDLLITFGDAFIVAGVIGLLVEIPLRAISQDDLSKAVFYAVFGIRAPTEYFDQLRDVCRTDCLSYASMWEINVSWHERPAIVAVEMTVSITTHNISSSPAEQRPIWLMGSAAGTPGSSFRRYSLRIEDDKGNVTQFPECSESRLRELAGPDVQPEDMITISLSDLVGHNQLIPPGGKSLAVCVGLVYLGSSAMIPLVQRYPTMGVRCLIRGDALADLDVTLSSGISPLRPDADGGVLDYSVPGLAMAGATFRFQYSPKQHQLGSSS